MRLVELAWFGNLELGRSGQKKERREKNYFISGALK
jgi:hypothetical protein